jgi:hypothetical protein
MLISFHTKRELESASHVGVNGNYSAVNAAIEAGSGRGTVQESEI